MLSSNHFNIQACILELAHVESTASVNDPDKQQHPNCQNSDLDMNIEEKNNMDVMKAELFAVKNPVPTVSNEMEVSSNDVSPTITVVTTYLRISFLGWMEFYDDWIELSSAAGRLAPLNTKSFGNRGENNVREEVKFLAKLWEKKSQSSPTNYATSPEPALVSPFYATVVNQFFISKGILNFQKLIAEKMLESCNLTSSSNLKLIFSVGLCADVLTSRFFEVNITSDDSMFGALVSYVKRYFQFLLQEELRATKTESFEQIIWSLERILKSHGFLLKDVAQELDPLYVAVALGCIQSPYLNRYLFILSV